MRDFETSVLCVEPHNKFNTWFSYQMSSFCIEYLFGTKVLDNYYTMNNWTIHLF